MTKILRECIDWTSIRLNAVSCIGFLTHDSVIFYLTALATISTIIYNGLNIYKYLTKKRKNEKQ